MASSPIRVSAAPTRKATLIPCGFAPIACPMRVAMALPTLTIGM